MDTVYCNVVYHYSKGFPKSLKEEAKREYMRLRTIAVDALNPNYENWNMEFERIYGKRDDYAADPEYNKFMAKKQDEILKVVNMQSEWFELYSSEECDLEARLKFNKNFNMHISIRVL